MNYVDDLTSNIFKNNRYQNTLGKIVICIKYITL